MRAFERARSEEQKEIRVGEIVSAAERLFGELEFEQITLSAIAREARFTRSNLYKYFKTREEIFLQLLERDLTALCDQIEQALGPQKRLSAKKWPSYGRKSSRDLGVFCVFLAIMHIDLEKGASLESLVRFKTVARQQMERMIELLCGNFPQLSAQAAEQFLAIALATASGLYPMTELSDKQEQAATRAGFSSYQGRFERYYEHAVWSCLEGALASRTR